MKARDVFGKCFPTIPFGNKSIQVKSENNGPPKRGQRGPGREESLNLTDGGEHRTCSDKIFMLVILVVIDVVE